MHKHTMTFMDYNEPPQQRTVDLYFNLSEAEITKLQIASDFGLQHDLEQATKNGDNKKLLEFMELLVHHAYGIKDADGIRFRKSPEIMAEFEQSAYYSDLYMSLFQEEGAVGARFINALLPAELIRRAEANARGEGELAQRAAAAQAFQPDSRSVFEQSRANLQDHKQPVQTVQEPVSTYREPSQQYVPQNQPAYPQIPSTEDQKTAEYAQQNPEQYQQFLDWQAQQGSQTGVQPGEVLQKDPNAPLTRAEYAEHIAATGQIPEGITGAIPRPPHESGAGFEVNTEQ